MEEAFYEYNRSDDHEKLKIDWEVSLVLRYKREKGDTTRIVCVLSYDVDIYWNIIIQQLQWSRDKRVAFRVNSSFDTVEFYSRLIEYSFSRKWTFVELKKFPEWIENASYNSKANFNYESLRWMLNQLNRKYNISKITNK